MDRYSKESDVESSSDEDICVLLQALEVDGKEINTTQTAKSWRSTLDEMRAPEKGGSEKYGKLMPQEHRYYTYQHQGNGRVKSTGCQLQRTSGDSENEASPGPQQYQRNSAFRRPAYSYQQANRCCSGCSDHEADARAHQLPGNGRVRRVGVSYHLARTPRYSENKACGGPRADQLPENGRVRRPERLQQQTSSSGYSNHGANARTYHQQQPGSRTYIRSHQQTSGRGYSSQQAKVRGYSNSLANDRDQHQVHHRVQDRSVNRSSSQITMEHYMQQNTQTNEMAQPRRRRLEWSHKGARVPPVQQCTRIQQHWQTQGLKAVRRCG